MLDRGDSPTLTSQALAPAPLWGTIVDGDLYTYHNPMWNQLNADPQRSLSRLDLHSGQVQTWQLPANWEAGDLMVLNGQVTLVHQDDQRGASDGLYQFDTASGELTLRLKVLNAARVFAS